MVFPVTSDERSRYRRVSRRAMLKGMGAGAAAVGLAACANNDAQVFAGAVAEPVETTTTTTTTNPPTTSTAAETPTTQPVERVFTDSPAVAGSMVISFTYTHGPVGKVEPPYVAVWVENAQGELLHTIALFFEQTRRGGRWLDHLDNWYAGDVERINAGGADTARTISSATRPPGDYAVMWDGFAQGVQLPQGDYFIAIEAAREDGPYSLIREPFQLTGALAQTQLPDDSELSGATVRIDV